MKVLNAIVGVCFTLSLVGCAAQRPHAANLLVEMPANSDGRAAATPTAAAGEGEYPIWDSCKKTVRGAALAVTAPIWIPVAIVTLGPAMWH
jgi:hypothetical protein